MGKLFGSLVVCLVASFPLSHVDAMKKGNKWRTGIAGSKSHGDNRENQLNMQDEPFDNLYAAPRINQDNYEYNAYNSPEIPSNEQIAVSEVSSAASGCKDASDLDIDFDIIRPWPKGSVPIVISKEFSPSQIKTIHKFIEDISRYTCVKFVNRTEGCAYVLVTKNYSIPWTFLGYSGQRQRLNLSNMAKQAVLRGFMNVLGIVSQHNTHNRDEHIVVKYENIDKRYWYQFRKFLSPTIMDEPYDFRSITHFIQSDYSKNTQDTVVPLNDEKVIAPMSTLSPHDIAKLNRFYQCRFVDK